MFRYYLVISALITSAAFTRADEKIFSTSTGQQTFQVTGLVLEVKPEEKSVKIKHDDIPGYMQAMTMTFEVKNTNELAGIGPGDPVSFRMIVDENFGWIEQIKKTGPKRNDLPTTGPFRFVKDVEPLNPGDKLPEYHFTNQLGQVFSTMDFKGQVLAVNFLFTRCPFPTFCPQTAKVFAETQKKLLSDTNAPAKWHLLTISFDPEFDKPAVLKRYAEHYGYDSSRWTFATGALIDITAIGNQLGLSFWRDETGGFDHNLRTAVFDKEGRLRKVFIGNTWSSDELVAEILNAAMVK